MKPRSLSPPKQSYHNPPPPPAPRPADTRSTSRAPSADRNPFARRLSDSKTSPPDDSNMSSTSSPYTVVQQSQSNAQKFNHNPFLMRDKNGTSSKVNSDGRTPPLPPRKPVLQPPLAPPPRHASYLLNSPTPAVPPKPTPPVIPPMLHASSSSSINTTHVTSPLIRQSLQASKAAQTMKKAEEQLERERVMQVLKKASSPRPRSSSPSKKLENSALSASGSGSSSGIGMVASERVPPLPARRASKSNPPSSTASSRRSVDQVASASIVPSRSPFSGSPFSVSPNAITTDLPTLPAPPTHPDRKPSDLSIPSAPSTPSSSQPPRVFRSKSMHHQSPPVPPPRRRRPESVQLTPVASPESSPFFAAPHPHLSPPKSAPQPSSSSTTGLSRHLSLQSHSRRDSSNRDPNLPNPPDSPMANLQRTLTSLQLKAQPRLDAARYKAEAGLSRRGYVHHPHRSPWVEEGEEGLMARKRNGADREDGAGVDRGYDGAVTDDEHSSDDERGRRLAAGWDKGTNDNLKWPAGEGWKPL